MKKNQLGKSDLYVSEIGFGSMSIGHDEQHGIRLVHEAIDRGVNFIDTADLYRFGEIEKTIGKALKGKRSDVILATKAGNHWEEGKEGWYWDPSKDYIERAAKDSLKRLGTDYIDLFQLHGGTIDDPIDDTIEAFEELKQEGLIREYGISSIRPNVIREYVRRSNIVSVMMQYSILDRRPEETALSLLEENNISVIARGPVAKGMLSDKTADKTPENGFLDYSKEEVLNVAEGIQNMADENRTTSQIALRYALSHPAVATVIPGASRLGQLVENIGAANVKLTAGEIENIRHLSKANVYDKHR
jgi:aryl-alcohol dehydrogenase-like predicted oxidoreductase